MSASAASTCFEDDKMAAEALEADTLRPFMIRDVYLGAPDFKRGMEGRPGRGGQGEEEGLEVDNV